MQSELIIFGPTGNSTVPTEDYLKAKLKERRDLGFDDLTMEELQEQLELILTKRHPKLTPAGANMSNQVKRPESLLPSYERRSYMAREAQQQRERDLPKDPRERDRIDGERYQEFHRREMGIYPRIAILTRREWINERKPTFDEWHGTGDYEAEDPVEPGAEESDSDDSTSRKRKSKKGTKPATPLSLTKVADNDRVHLVKMGDKLKRGREQKILGLLDEQPDKISTIAKLSEIYAKQFEIPRKLAHRNVQFFIKNAVIRKDVEVVR